MLVMNKIDNIVVDQHNMKNIIINEDDVDDTKNEDASIDIDKDIQIEENYYNINNNYYNNIINILDIRHLVKYDNMYGFIMSMFLIYLSIYIYMYDASKFFFSVEQDDDDDDNFFDYDDDEFNNESNNNNNNTRSRSSSSGGSNFFEQLYSTVSSPFSGSPLSKRQVKNVLGKPYINGSCGLINLGNTCYINSTLQCLSAIPEFRHIFLNPELKTRINYDSKFGTHGKLALAVGELLNEMWGNEFTAVAPIKFRKTIVKKYKMFGGTEHQDSHEFLTTLIDNLHEDLNCAKHSKYRRRGSSFDHLNAHERSVRTLAEYKLSNQSPLMDIFLGQVRSTVTCGICSHSNPSFDTSWQISLPLPPPSIFINVKVFPSDLESEPVVFGFWVFKNPEILTITKSCVDMIAEQYGRDTRPSNIILCTVANDGTGAVSDVCITSDGLKRLSGGEMLYAFEMDNSIYKSSFNDTKTFSNDYDEDDIDVNNNNNNNNNVYDNDILEYNGTFVPFVHRIYKEDNGGKYTIIGRPGLVFVPNDCGTIQFNAKTCYEVLKSVDVNMIQKENDDSSSTSSLWFDENNADHLLQLLRYGILRIVSSNSLLWRRGSDVPDGDDNVHNWLPSRKMHVTFDWYEDSIYDDEKASAAFLHTTFTHRPNNEDSRSSISLQDCFHHYTQTEDSLEYHCSECKKRVQAKKDLKFIKLPTVLVVLLKRFESDLKKITSNVEFPVTGLDMAPYMCENVVANGDQLDNNEYMYDLVALSTHVGSLSSGHYTAYSCLGEENWIFFNDEKSRPLKSQQWKKNLDIDTSSVYILVYRKRMFDSGFNDNHNNNNNNNATSTPRRRVIQRYKSSSNDDSDGGVGENDNLRPPKLSPFYSTGL